MSLGREQTPALLLRVCGSVSVQSRIVTPPSPPLSPATTHSDYPHPPLPMSALRAIIIMPCINNASQYINNASLQHEEGAVMEAEGGDRYTWSFPGSAIIS